MIQTILKATIIFLFSTAPSSALSEVYSRSSARTQARVDPIHQFTPGIWVENLAVRSNGQILTTYLIPSASVVQIDPFDKSARPINITTFPGGMASLGIAELGQDVFYVATLNLTTSPLAPIPGTGAIWELDLRHFRPGISGSAKIRMIVGIPDSVLVNGMTTLGPDSNTLLVADSGAGKVFRVDVEKKTYGTAIEGDPAMAPVSGFGINGVRALGNTLYWTNTDKGLFCSAGIDLKTRSRAQGGVRGQTKCTSVIGGDDFTFDIAGMNVYLAQNTQNMLATSKIPIAGAGGFVTVAGNLNQTTIAGPSSAAFGRTTRDKNVVYVSMNGGLANPINGTIVVGGGVVAVELGRLYNH